MASELEQVTAWTFTREVALPEDVAANLVQGEQAYAAYATIRDVAVITNKRILVRDAQGVTGKKVEIYSLPWSSVCMWSCENAGTIDINSEIELWTKIGHLKLKLGRDVDIRKLDQLISYFVLVRP